jgi:hypothetical protein
MWWYKKTAMSCKTAIQTFISECLFLSLLPFVNCPPRSSGHKTYGLFFFSFITALVSSVLDKLAVYLLLPTLATM